MSGFSFRDGAVRCRGLARRVLLLLMAVATMLPLVLSGGSIASAATTSISCGNELLCEVVDEGSLTARITKYNPNSSTGSDIEIPATWQKDGKTYTITEIADNVFSGQQLTAVSFASGSKITKIGSSAFKSNGFTSISLPSTVVSLGSSAFYACAQLTSIDLSATGVTAVPDSAFQACLSLTSAKLNAGTTSIGEEAFYDAPVERLEVPSTIQGIGNWAFYEGPRRVVIGRVPDASIVKGLLAITKGVVEWKATGNTAVDKSCFWFDKNTGTILGLKEAGHTGCAHAAYHQSNASLVIPAQIANTDVTAIAGGAFFDSHRNNIAGLSFEDGSRVASIGMRAFSSCSKLTSLLLPDSLESIGDGAFAYASSVSEVLIPASVKTIGITVFSYCSSLAKVTFETDVNGDSAIGSIGTNAFGIDPKLVEIDITGKTEDSVSGAPWGAEYAAMKWKDATDDPQVVAVKGEDGSDWLYNTVTQKLVSYAGANGDGSTDLLVPSKVTWTGTDGTAHEAVPTSIGSGAVQSRGSFKSVTVPGNITVIDYWRAFQSTKFESLTLGDGVKTIGQYAFDNCGLSSVSLPQSLTSIGKQAFANNSLTSVTIPRNVASIAADAFSNNASLTKIGVDQCRLVSVNGYPLALDAVKNNQPWCTDADAATRITVSYKDDAMPLIVPDTTANRAIAVGGESGLDVDLSHAVVVDAESNTASVNVLSRMNYKGSSIKLDSLTVDGQDATGGKSQTNSQDWLAGSKSNITQNGTVTFVSSFTDGGRQSSVAVSVAVDAFHRVTYDVNAPAGEQVTGQAPVDATGYVKGHKVSVLDGSGMYVGLSQAAARYVFAGWNTRADGQGETYKAGEKMVMPDGDTTLYAVWRQVTDVSFTLDANGGMFDDTASKTTVSATGMPGESLTTATGYKEPTRAGYTFKGWAETKDSTDLSTIIPIEDKRTFYAVWQKADVTVTFDANAGKLTDDKSTVTSTGKYGDTLTVPTNPTRTGYAFAGWHTNPSDESTKLDTANAKYPATPTTYLAKWTANNNQVTFAKGDHGSISGTTGYTVQSGAKVPGKPTVNADAGYTFVGWQSSEDNLTYADAAVTSYVVSGGNAKVTFTAQYVQNVKCTVAFNADGGQFAGGGSLVVMSDAKGKAYATPANPTRDGYTFSKWDPAPSGKFDTEGVTVFTAQWTANDNDVKFDAGADGTTKIPALLKVKTDATISSATGFVTPDVAANEGKRFVGWKSSVDGAVYRADQIGSLTVTQGVTFTAVYEDEDSGSVSVLFDYAGGKDRDGKAYAFMTGKRGEAYTTPADPTRDGYVFRGWDPSPSGKYETTQTFTAQWEVNERTVTFIVGDGGTMTAPASLKVRLGQSVSTATGFVQPDVTAKSGKRFMGWVFSVDGGLYQPDRIGALTVTQDVTFTAQYEDSPDTTVVVVFDYAGGKDAGDKAYAFMTGKQGETYSVPTGLTREGYTFTGWDPTPSGKYETSTTFTAQWTVNANTVEFVAGDHGTLSGTTSYRVQSGGKVPGRPGVNATAGYTFVGWKSSEDGKVYDDADIAEYVVSGRNQTVTFTAQYVQDVECTVVFNANGGLIDGRDSSVILTGDRGSAYATPADPTREGYVFKGWDPAPSGKYDGGIVTVFTAQWERDERTVTFIVGDGGTMTAPASLKVRTGQSVSTATGFVQPDVTAKTGKRFMGWQFSVGGGVFQPDQVGGLTITSDVTFTAVYEDLPDTTVVLEFDYAGGKDASGKAYAFMTGRQGETYTVPTGLTRDGYTFTGWSPTPSGKYETSTTFTAQWEASDRTVTFDVGDGGTMTAPGSLKVKTGQAVSTATGFVQPDVTPKSGKRFMGWVFSVDGGLYQPDRIGALTVTRDVTFTAKYEDSPDSTVVVVFDYEGGKDANGRPYVTMTGKQGGTYAIPADPTREGYTFKGWDPTPSGVYGISVVYRAQWTVNENTVRFEPGEHGTLSGTTQYTVKTGGTVGGKPAVSAAAGYVFTGWKSSEDDRVYADEEIADYLVSGRNREVTFTAQYEQDKQGEACVVVFNPDGGLIDGRGDLVTLTGAKGTKYAIPADPTREGYTFAGWDRTPSGTFDGEGLVEFTARWTANANTVTFNAGSYGTTKVPGSLEVRTGQSISSATGFVQPDVTVTTAGKRFLGWVSSVDGGLYQPSQIGGLPVTSGMTFTAVYDDEPTDSVAVRFEYAGGTDAAGRSFVELTGRKGETYTTPVSPTRDGYTFTGWNPTPNGRYESAATYTAQWTANTYDITYKPEGGTLPDSAPKTHTYGEETKLPTPEKDGYTFDGWVDQDGKKIDSVPADAKDTTVTAKWTPNTYNITYNPDGGTLPDNAPKTHTYGEETKLPTPEKDGYTFDGWVDQDGKKIDSVPADGKDTTVTAKWTAKDNQVTFDAGTDGALKTGVKNPLTVKTDAKISTAAGFAQPDVTANAGKRFMGWQSSVDGGLYQPDRIGNLTVRTPVTFTAVYEDASGGLVTVLFDYNGGKDRDGKAYTALTGKPGAAYTTPANPTRDGYTFQKWDPTPSGKYQTTTTHTAQWKANQYNITYDTNGGTLPDNAPKKHTYGEDTKLPTPTKDGSTFDGWYDENGKKIDSIPADAKDTKVTAKWTTNQLVRLGGAVRYDTMGKVVSQAYTGTASTVIVASGANYPDALAASGLSGVLDAPIVLTDPKTLSSQAIDQLKRLKPSRIIIAGGEDAVSATVATQLEPYANAVERQGGATRYDTSYLLYQRGLGSWGSTAIVATGADYADALSVSSYAYAGKAPVFLCDPNTGLTGTQRTALAKFKRVIVVGGVNAVPVKYVTGLPGMTRLAGATRYETSVNLAKWTQKNGLGMDGVVYARGDDYPDALVSGPLAGRNKAPVLLVSDPKSPAVSYSAGFKGKVTKAYVAGGPKAISQDTANALADALGIARP